MNKNQYGFGALGIVVIVLVLSAIVGTGYLFLKKSNTKDTAITFSTETSQTPTPKPAAADPYDGWNTFTLKYEKATFRYPGSWQLTDTSFADAKVTGGGMDVIQFHGSNGFEMNIATGGPNDYGFPFGGLTSISTEPVTFLGKQAYMHFAQTGSENTGIADKIHLTSTKTGLTDFPADKNVIAPSYKDGIIEDKYLIYMDYNANVNKASNAAVYPHYPLSKVLKDENYLNAKLVIESFKY